MEGPATTSDVEFSAFFRRYYRLIVTVAHQRLGEWSAAEDAAAEAFRITWGHRSAGGELTLPWLYATLRNVVGHEYRRRGRAPLLTDDVGPLDVDPQTGEFERTSDTSVEVRRRLAELSSADREVLYMAYWEDLTREEIGAVLGCSTTAVTTRLQRARARLHALLAEPATESLAGTREASDG